ncbi:MAG: hypothetical protein AAF652_03760 [Cyanobacteria bacterium P01_C01_bin.72]
MSLKILLQTSLLTTDKDDWTICRFSLLKNYLNSLKDDAGNPLIQAVARDRQPDSSGNDPVLSNLDIQDFDELWLFALDVGDGLSPQELSGVNHFHQQGGGIFTARDHQDIGVSLCDITSIGSYHYFHSQQNNPDDSRCRRDDHKTTSINWPNYHSGRNGDYQKIQPVEPVHELLKNHQSSQGVIEYFPAHPHEGGIGVPPGFAHARVIATGTSKTTKRQFNIAIAGERVKDAAGNLLGRVVAESTFHHLADYNWDITAGCPSFVEEAPGDGVQKHPERLEDIYTYVKNLAFWLAPNR